MQVTVANAIWHQTQFHTEKHFWLEAENHLANLQISGVQLVLFPGLTGQLHSYSIFKSAFDAPDCLATIAKQRAVFEQGFSRLAAKYQIYLCPGTTIMEKNNDYHIVAPLFNPQGEKIGSQRQTHLSPAEKAWGLVQGQEISTWSTDIGHLGLIVGRDSWHPEVSRILALQGADLVLAPTAVPAPYNPWLQIAAMWQQVQQNQFFALENWFDGKFASTIYQGTAPILAPCEMTTEETGYLADGKEKLIAQLDFAKRQQVIVDYPLLKLLNKSLYKQYLPRLYERIANHDQDDFIRKNS